jgi:hypothetical protein
MKKSSDAFDQRVVVDSLRFALVFRRSKLGLVGYCLLECFHVHSKRLVYCGLE